MANEKKPRPKWLQWALQTFLALMVALGAIVAMDLWRAPDGKPLTTLHLTTIDGQTVDFTAADPPTILYFWGSWCGFCRKTSPMINELAHEGYRVISVAMSSGTPTDVEQYLQHHGWRFPVVNDPDGAISAAFSVVATPTIAIIDDQKITLSTTGLTSKWGLKMRLWLARLLKSDKK